MSLKFESANHTMKAESNFSDVEYEMDISFMYLSMSKVIIGGLISYIKSEIMRLVAMYPLTPSPSNNTSYFKLSINIFSLSRVFLWSPLLRFVRITLAVSKPPEKTQPIFPHFKSPSKLYEISLELTNDESDGPVNQKTASVPSGLNFTSMIKTPFESYSNICVMSRSS